MLVEILAAKAKYRPDAIIALGDLKHSYNPLDLRVAKWWVKAIKTIGPLYILLGNHDRLSQSHQSKNWLDILRAAGAETISTPRWIKLCSVEQPGYGAFLPFTADRKQEKEWAKQLDSERPKDGVSVLLFHTEIGGGILNASGTKTGGITLEGLRADEYDFCAGGHIHIHQRIGNNCIYVGSPFCHDWSEANSPHGLVLLEITETHRLITHLPTATAGWYDATWLQSTKTKPETGSYIRDRVKVSSKRMNAQLKEAEDKLRTKYGADMRYFVLPVIEQQKAEVELKGVTDDEKAAEYVAATWPEGAKGVAKHAVGYLSSVLSKVPPSLAGKRLRFISLEAENVLSFHKVKFKLNRLGLVLLRGVNRDWNKQSNGSGKTSLLSLLYLALTGETPKGQKTDEWANEHTEDTAWVKLRFLDERNRKIEIYRARPHAIKLTIDGEDQSSGLTGTRKNETQTLVENITGYDKRLLLNAVYIDQSIANGFVFGTQKDRMDLVAKLQNLERFDDATKLVAADIKKAELKRVDTEETIYKLESDISRYEEELEDSEQVIVAAWAKQHASANAEVQRLLGLKQSQAGSKDFYDDLQQRVDNQRADHALLLSKQSDAYAVIYAAKKRKAEAQELIDAGKCGQCGQDSIEAGENIMATENKAQAKAQAQVAKLTISLASLSLEISKADKRLRDYKAGIERTEDQLDSARELLASVEESVKVADERNAQLQAKRDKANTAIASAQRALKACRELQHEIDIERELYDYAKRAFHRSGMPMYISAALCPVLNAAAEEYSEIFYGGKIKVLFEVEDGEFVIRIINPAGSSEVSGQSVGESAMAGLITAFALRDVAPKTNLLILDEPGHGLDGEGARQFAQGLLELKKRYESLLLTTHSSIIEGALSGETIWTVTKHKKISQLSSC